MAMHYRLLCLVIWIPWNEKEFHSKEFPVPAYRLFIFHFISTAAAPLSLFFRFHKMNQLLCVCIAFYLSFNVYVCHPNVLMVSWENTLFLHRLSLIKNYRKVGVRKKKLKWKEKGKSFKGWYNSSSSSTTTTTINNHHHHHSQPLAICLAEKKLATMRQMHNSMCTILRCCWMERRD